METLENAAIAAYNEVRDLLLDSEMASAVTGGLTVLYGPPVQNPDYFMISFQGGGAAPVNYERWPEELLYIADEFKSGNHYKFGRNLCRFAREVDIYGSLLSKTVAVPAVFPGAKESGANKWLAKTRPRARWREFSVRWVEKLIEAAQPKVILIFGDKASKALGLSNRWENREFNHGQGWMTQGQTEYLGVPVVFCSHLTRYVGSEVIRSLETAKCLAETK